ncbi:MAG TPA: tetratricopeptide repeat protein [Lacunisphaera sp.]|nr:tetratricopeptide repeat protein [Lacunisphaera sp.]
MHRITGLLVLAFASTALGLEPAQGDRIRDLIRHRQFPEAQAELETIVAANPQDAEAQYRLGKVRLDRGQLEGSVTALETAASLAPANSEYFRVLGDAYGISAQRAGLFSKLGFARKCKAAYDKAVELDPKNINARWSVMEYCRQAPSIVGGGMDGAYAQAAEIKKLDARRGLAAYAMLYATEKKYDEAFAMFADALKAAPDDYEVLYQVGRFAAISGREPDRGIVALQHCLELSPPVNSPGHAPVQWRLGNLLESKGDKAGARAAYEAALKIDPQFPQALEALKKLP